MTNKAGHARRKTIRSYRPLVELLEERSLLSTNYWTNSSGGDWANSSNWSLAAVPVSGDDVVINLAGNFTVSLTSGSSTIHSLSVSNTLVLDGGSLTSTNAIQVAGVLDFESGSLTSSNGITVSGGTFEYDGGTLSANVTIRNSALILDGGNSSATFTVNGNSSLSGSVVAGQSIWVQGGANSANTILTVANGASSAGTIKMESTVGSSYLSDMPETPFCFLHGSIRN